VVPPVVVETEAEVDGRTTGGAAALADYLVSEGVTTELHDENVEVSHRKLLHWRALAEGAGGGHGDRTW
jgi:hypothetical protein